MKCFKLITCFFLHKNTLFSTNMKKIKKSSMMKKTVKRIRRYKMNKLYLKFGHVIAAIALFFATVSVDSTCRWVMYQDTIPESVMRLRKNR